VTTENVERYSYRRPEGDVTQLGRRGSSRCEQTVIVSGHGETNQGRGQLNNPTPNLKQLSHIQPSKLTVQNVVNNIQRSM